MHTAKTGILHKKELVALKWYRTFSPAAFLSAALIIPCSFFMQVKNGEICWRANGASDWQHTGVYAAQLPNSADREALETGLLLSDREALTRALEDYCS